MGYSGIGREGWVALSLGDRRRMGTAQGIGSPPHAASPSLHGSALSIPHGSTSKRITVTRRPPQVLIARRSCGLRSRGLRHSDRRVQRLAHTEKKDETHRDQELGQSEDHEQWLQEAINELSSAAT